MLYGNGPSKQPFRCLDIMPVVYLFHVSALWDSSQRQQCQPAWFHQLNPSVLPHFQKLSSATNTRLGENVLSDYLNKAWNSTDLKGNPFWTLWLLCWGPTQPTTQMTTLHMPCTLILLRGGVTLTLQRYTIDRTSGISSIFFHSIGWMAFASNTILI